MNGQENRPARFDDGCVAFDHPPGFTFNVGTENPLWVRQIHGRHTERYTSDMFLWIHWGYQVIKHPLSGTWVDGRLPGYRETGRRDISHTWVITEFCPTPEAFDFACRRRRGCLVAGFAWRSTGPVDPNGFARVLDSITLDIVGLRKRAAKIVREAQADVRRRERREEDFSHWAASLKAGKPVGVPARGAVVLNRSPDAVPGKGESLYRDRMVSFVHPRNCPVRREINGELLELRGRRGPRKEDGFTLRFSRSFSSESSMPDLPIIHRWLFRDMLEWVVVGGWRMMRERHSTGRGGRVGFSSVAYYWLPQHPDVRSAAEWRRLCIQPHAMVAMLIWNNPFGAVDADMVVRILETLRIPGLASLGAKAERRARIEAAGLAKKKMMKDQAPWS